MFSSGLLRQKIWIEILLVSCEGGTWKNAYHVIPNDINNLSYLAPTNHIEVVKARKSTCWSFFTEIAKFDNATSAVVTLQV